MKLKSGKNRCCTSVCYPMNNGSNFSSQPMSAYQMYGVPMQSALPDNSYYASRNISTYPSSFASQQYGGYTSGAVGVPTSSYSNYSPAVGQTYQSYPMTQPTPFLGTTSGYTSYQPTSSVMQPTSRNISNFTPASASYASAPVTYGAPRLSMPTNVGYSQTMSSSMHQAPYSTRGFGGSYAPVGGMYSTPYLNQPGYYGGYNGGYTGGYNGGYNAGMCGTTCPAPVCAPVCKKKSSSNKKNNCCPPQPVCCKPPKQKCCPPQPICCPAPPQMYCAPMYMNPCAPTCMQKKRSS